MAYGSTFDSGEGVFWDVGDDLTDAAAKSVALRERPGCRRCGAGQCSYCGVKVQPQPGNSRIPLCHRCDEITSGPSASEIDVETEAALPITLPCQRRGFGRPAAKARSSSFVGA